jgi:hypothetical protein
MGKRNNKRINYKRLRKKGRSKRYNVDRKRLEKIDKANHRRKLKVSIKLRLKKLKQMVNLKHQYLRE